MTTKRQLDPYSLMVVSKYFESIDDFINMELATPKARCNMEKFHFNPIALDEWSRQFFTSLQTLHLYNKEDNKFESETFFKKVFWYRIDYGNWMKKKVNVEYKNVVLTDGISEVMNGIPEGITEIGYYCFKRREDLEELVIPNSVTLIGHGFLWGCDHLTAMTIPTHWEQVGNKFHINRSFFSLFDIPSSVKRINGKEVVIEEVKEFEIPSNVTKISERCFSYYNFTKIIIPTSVVEIGDQCFNYMKSLKEIEIPRSVTKFGNGLFLSCSSLTSITLHDNYNEVKNYDFYCCESLSSVVLPSTVTKIGYCAFEYCSSLTSINLKKVKEFGDSCFWCSGITKENHPQLPDNCW